MLVTGAPSEGVMQPASALARRAPTAFVRDHGPWFSTVGLGLAADVPPAPEHDDARMPRVLVTFGSKHGATAEIAEVVADTLRAGGLDAECVAAGVVDRLDGYDAVILGSAVYMRRWRREARRFVHHFAAELAQRPFWVFSSGPVGDPAKDNPAWLEPGRTIRELERLGAREHVVFGGRSTSSGVPEEFRDRRDWDEIRAWARSIAASLPVTAEA
jgi:menaquinone-dependent protoporphyrinogen oxidase